MKEEYIVEWYVTRNEDRVAEDCVEMLKKHLCDSSIECVNNEGVHALLSDIVGFSFQLRKGFVKSDAVAKAKVQEHCISRLPIFSFCVTGLLVMKVLVRYGSSLRIQIHFFENVDTCVGVCSIHTDGLFASVSDDTYCRKRKRPRAKTTGTRSDCYINTS